MESSVLTSGIQCTDNLHEGTYQLKRRRLKPDVRDSPEYPGADIDMADI